MKTIKRIIFVLITFLFLGCSSGKTIPSTTEVEKLTETTVFKDTIVYRTLPSDTVRIEAQTGYLTLNLNPITAQNSYSEAKAWVINGVQFLELINLEKKLAFSLQNKVEIKSHSKTKTTDTVKIIKHIPTLYKWAFYIVLVQLIIGLILFAFLLKAKLF